MVSVTKSIRVNQSHIQTSLLPVTHMPFKKGELEISAARGGGLEEIAGSDSSSESSGEADRDWEDDDNKSAGSLDGLVWYCVRIIGFPPFVIYEVLIGCEFSGGKA